MKNKKIILILLGASLGVVAFFGWPIFRGLVTPEIRDVLIVREVGSPMVVPAKSATLEPVEVKTEKKAPLAMVDPFALRLDVTSKLASGISGEASVGGLKLEGIWFNSELKAAFIAGNVATEGEIVAGWRVRKIYKDRVELVRQNELKTLKLEDIYYE